MTTGLPPYPADKAVRSIPLAVVLTIVTCGFYAIYWQYMQFQTLNGWLGREEHNFLMYLLLSIVTCGIYALYYEYKFAQSIQDVQRARGMVVNENLPMIALGLALFGLTVITWCIEQNTINEWYGQS